MKLKDAIFCGFTDEDLEEIRKAKGAGENEITFSDSQDIADIIGVDVITMILPGFQITFIKGAKEVE